VETYRAVVEKDRTGVTKKGQILNDPSYTYWQSYCEDNSKLEKRDTKYSEGVEKDIQKMQTESDKIEDVIVNFKSKMQKLTPANKLKVGNKLKELNIDNPLQTDNLEGMAKIIEFMDAM
jgi:hypothetical protein